MNLKLLHKRANRNRRLKGVFSAFIPKIKYEVRNPTGNWENFFGNYVGQKYGPYDTSTCWNFAGVEIMETQLEYLMKTGQFSDEAMKWFKDNGYIDSDGDFYLSRRWAAIISGVKDNGNNHVNFWEIVEKVGIIPFSMLPYSTEDAADELSQDDFNNEYFDPKVITLEMEKLGKEFLKWVKIEHEEVGTRWQRRDTKFIMSELKQSPLHLGVPVPQDGTWNREFVKWTGRMQPDHSIECYNYKEFSDYPWFIYDSYHPHLKHLSADYYVPLITKAVITAIPVPVKTEVKKSVWTLVWEAVHNFFVSKQKGLIPLPDDGYMGTI